MSSYVVVEKERLTRVKALFLANDDNHLHDLEDVIQAAKVEAWKIGCKDNVKVLNIFQCNYPNGYVVVVQNSGRRVGN